MAIVYWEVELSLMIPLLISVMAIHPKEEQGILLLLHSLIWLL